MDGNSLRALQAIHDMRSLNPNFAVAKFLRSSDEKLAYLPIFVRVNPDKLRFVGPSGRFCS